jgi:hypothetical protein
MFSLWRKLTYQKLSQESLDGSILDLGGSKNAEYHGLIKGTHDIKVANLDDKYGYDLCFDLEKTFPIDSESFENLLAINVIEHIYNYQNFFNESFRILKRGGTMIIAVPYLFQIHPCPNDYWRYTRSSLEKILTEAGFREIHIEPLGSGAFSALCNLSFGVLRFNLLRIIIEKICVFFDRVIHAIKPSNLLSSDFFPIGYYVIAKK